MPDHPPPDLRPELLDDFDAECDELFGQMRVLLADLDGRSAPAAGPEAIEGLYRSMHSFKGVCGIVGLRIAEELAHASEDVLRKFSAGRSAPTDQVIELLAGALHRLEQIVAAHRMGETLPMIEDLLASLRASRVAPATAGRSPSESDVAPSGGTLWLARFLPSTELDPRGVNVASIRQRLSNLGELLRVEPRVRPGGGISFEFTVRLVDAQPGNLEVWRADGVELGPETKPAEPSPGAVATVRPASIAEQFTPPISAGAALSIAPSHIVRVDLGRLDELMRIMGELVIHRSRLEEQLARMGRGRDELGEVSLALSRSLRDLRSTIMRVRLVPMAEIFARLPFVLRDLATERKKSVRLVIRGQETEIDKYLVERLKEPLLHLVRNAVSHGVEPPAERVAAGKPSEAVLTLRAASAGQAVLLTVEDDGRGVDLAKVAAGAKAAGLPWSATPTEAEILAVLCRPGFSTRDEADVVAGRGVGMDVVHTTLRELGGVLTLETEQGRFTRFHLRLPLTLSIIDAFIVSSADRICAMPRALVEEIVEIEETDIRPVGRAEVMPYRHGVLPITRLSRFLGVPAGNRNRAPVLVMTSERGLAGLVVDQVRSHREVVVRPIADPLLRVPGIAGATELGDGRPVRILDPDALHRGALRPRTAASFASP